ncbi:MAG: hypothetical protein BA862_02435 [Desulfobulbaceae bacterium S3730MH12]|nr:MAG: hypothetical protein BA866_04100 [Desulfobulbaceae bacterium S5133MH15]OEU57334.1 MAG: hypothetical protein BA862_02435 [Desulfobulbaceae bacterium S3730MH12]OEU83044.1 MAG: hypothetical protein BA873_03895 [Desulfobulbaceae bacterium C00003063]
MSDILILGTSIKIINQYYSYRQAKKETLPFFLSIQCTFYASCKYTHQSSTSSRLINTIYTVFTGC